MLLLQFSSLAANSMLNSNAIWNLVLQGIANAKTSRKISVYSRFIRCSRQFGNILLD